jgi:hypothetical protein
MELVGIEPTTSDMQNLCSSQLSYSPKMGLGRIELPTSHLLGVRSNQLSYRPKFTN